MSDVSKFSSRDIKGWLERETSSLFVPIHAKAQKLTDEMRKMLGNLFDSSKMLLENSQKEIEKRNAKTYGRARALNKLARLFVDRIRQIKVPDKVMYDSFRDFVQETQRAFAVTDADVRNFFPRVSPFFILDRRKFQIVFEKAKDLLKELDSFLAREYVKAKTLEETFQLIEKLHALENQLAGLKEQKARAHSEKAHVEAEIAEIQKKAADLKSGASLSLLVQTTAEIEALSTEVKQSLQHLQKPFVKLQSLATHGEGSGLTLEETRKLEQYVENPFQALGGEETGYPLLKQILHKVSRAMSEGKLKLKPEKTRKAEQVIDSILSKDSLASLHQKSLEAVMRKNQLSNSLEVVETEKELSKLKEHRERLETRKKVVEGEQTTLDRTSHETAEKVGSHKTQIEKNIFDFMSRMVRIE